VNPSPHAPKLWLDACALARLRQEALPPPPTDRAEALRERAGTDPIAKAWLEAFETEARQADRIARALEFEAASVRLPDGSALTIDEAERTLAHKEETRSHASLRGFLDETCGKSLRFDSFRSGNRAPTLEFTREFLAGTLGARDAAREILETLAKEPLESPRSLARALDLPDPNGGFSADAALALISASKKCLRTPNRTIRRIRVPKRLTGLTLENPESVLFGTAEPVLRLKRHERSVFGGARALLMAMQSAMEGTPWGARALGLGMASAVARRTVLSQPKDSAERAERAMVAVGLLEARSAAALWLAHGDEPHEDADREALSNALGSDAGQVNLREGLDELNPAEVHERLCAASGVLLLREAFDEAYATRPLAWQLMRELPTPSAAEASKAWAALVVERA
jgi:hypothetical protein